MTVKKIRFNILDVIIILFILSSIVLGMYVFFPEINPINTETTNAKFTVTITGCDKEVAQAFLEAFQENNESKKAPFLKVGEKEMVDAKFIDCEISPSTIYLPNIQTKQPVPVTDESSWNIKLVLDAEVKETDEAFILGNTPLRVGSEITVVCQKATGNGCVEKMITYN